jgi:hypothetical protein
MQLAIKYDASTEGTDDWTEIRSWFSRAVDVIGAKEVAYRLNIAATNLSDAIKEAERKSIKGRWIAVVLNMAPQPLVQDYLQIVSRQHGYEEPKLKKPRDFEAKSRRERDWMSKNAPALLEVMDKELGQ